MTMFDEMFDRFASALTTLRLD